MIEGLSWSDEGFIAISGALLELSERVDRTFLDLAASFAADREEIGPLLSVHDLRKIDYFSSFPHLMTFPGSAAADAETLHAIAGANGADARGPLDVPRLAPVTTILAPAACYGVYISRQGREIESATCITIRGLCFRAERTFQPLVRQPSFSMREIVHLGTRETVEAFLREARSRVLDLSRSWGLEPSIEAATDPFFDPSRSPKYLHAKLFPSKYELVENTVAIGSFNDHRNFFGEAYEISCGGEPIHTACVAFGIERWLHSILERHGTEPARWPAVRAGSQ